MDDPSGTPAETKVTLRRLLGQMRPSIAEGRLTLETGVPVSTSDQPAKTTVYYTPYIGSTIALYDGTRWRLYTFTERSLALGTLTADKNYDVFLYDNAGTLTLELSAAWTTDTARADALAQQDGIDVKSGATTRRLVGTIRTVTTTTTEDSLAKRFVANRNQQIARAMRVMETTDSWTYATSTWRSLNNSTANRVQWVSCVSTDALAIMTVANQSATSTGSAHGVGIDSTSTPSGTIAILTLVVTTGQRMGTAGVSVTLGIGYHFLQALEYRDSGTVTIYGDAGAVTMQSGIWGWVRL